MDLALNNLQWLICHKTQPNPTHMLHRIVNGSLRNERGKIDI